MNNLKLNLGCGQVRPEGWINTDSSLNSLIQQLPLGKKMAKLLGANQEYQSGNAKYMNLNKKWTQIQNSSVEVVYASHLFEHLSSQSASLFLSEAYRVLAPNGTIRLVVPNLSAHATLYIEEFNKGNKDAYKQFMWALNMHLEGQYPPNKMLHNLIGSFQGYPHQHKYMYDFFALASKLGDHGFVDVVESTHGLSQNIKSIGDVENETIKGYGLSLYIEGKKPAH